MKCFVFAVLFLIGLCQVEIPAGVINLDDFEAIKERCDKKGGAGTYEKVKTAGEETQKCIKAIIDVEKIKTEVQTGSVDEVAAKYCLKRPHITECVKKLYNAVQPCLEESEKIAMEVTGSILTQISDFVCFNDGERIAMFVAEEGIECLNSRVDIIKNCINQTLKFNPATFSPSLIIDEKKCDNLTAIQECIVKDLEDHCTNPSPPSIIDALFHLVKKTACKEAKSKRSITWQRTTIQEKVIKSWEDKINATCQKNGGDGAFENLMASVNKSRNCFRKYTFFVSPEDFYAYDLSNCSTDSRNALKNCLAEREKYFPDFLLAVTESLYGSYHRHVGKMYAVLGANVVVFVSCMDTLRQDEFKTKLNNCSSTILNEHTDANNIITLPPKSQVCESLTEEVTCISNLIKSTCGNDTSISQFTDEYVSSLSRVAPCQNKTIAEDAN